MRNQTMERPVRSKANCKIWLDRNVNGHPIKFMCDGLIDEDNNVFIYIYESLSYAFSIRDFDDLIYTIYPGC